MLEVLSKQVSRLRAPNPGPMTLSGTNSYIVAGAVVIDPGPKIESHIKALAHAAKIELILITHGHPDHYPGATLLRELTNAPIAAYQTAGFEHQINLTNKQTLDIAGVKIRTIFTPGHAQDHLCYYLEEEAALFTGDNILGQGTTVVAPPKGDMRAYLASLRLLKEEYSQAKVIYGGHGEAILSPAAKIDEYLAHRKARQDQLMAALQTSPTVPQLVERIYQDVERRLWPAAARQVLAYLIMLENQGLVSSRDVSQNEAVGDISILDPSLASSDPVAAAELGLYKDDSPRLLRYSLV